MRTATDKAATLAHYQRQAAIAAGKVTPEMLSEALGPLACEAILSALEHRQFHLAGMIVEALRQQLVVEPIPQPEVSDSDFGAFEEAAR
jgi:hypothetical protein